MILHTRIGALLDTLKPDMRQHQVARGNNRRVVRNVHEMLRARCDDAHGSGGAVVRKFDSASCFAPESEAEAAPASEAA